MPFRRSSGTGIWESAIRTGLGPTGTGKTEIIRETIHYLYGDEEEKLLRLDMSEFGETAGVDVGKKLVGYTEKEPGRLYDFLEKNTEGAILYDEFEKAHKDMAKYMLQQIDAGRVTLWNNRTYDISRFLLFFTSNVGRLSTARDDVQFSGICCPLRQIRLRDFRLQQSQTGTSASDHPQIH